MEHQHSSLSSFGQRMLKLNDAVPMIIIIFLSLPIIEQVTILKMFGTAVLAYLGIAALKKYQEMGYAKEFMKDAVYGVCFCISALTFGTGNIIYGLLATVLLVLCIMGPDVIRNTAMPRLHAFMLHFNSSLALSPVVSDRLFYWSKQYSNMNMFVFVHQDRDNFNLTAESLYFYSSKFAGMLQTKYDVKKGDVICSTLPNSPERLFCDFGSMLAGATTVPGYTRLPDGRDIINNLKKSKSKLLIVDPESDVWQIVRKTSRNPECFYSDDLPFLRHVIFVDTSIGPKGISSFTKYLGSGVDHKHVAIEPSDLATLLHTSGSTGLSKLVQTTHARLFILAKQNLQRLNVEYGKKIYRDKPLGFTGGFPYFCLEGPVTQYILDERSDTISDTTERVKYIWNVICKEEIHSTYDSPLFLLTLLTMSDLLKLSKWKMETICIAGQPVKRNVAKAIGKVCKNLHVGYGSTESGFNTLARYSRDDEVRDFSVGPVLSGSQIQVVDCQGNILPRGEVGEITVKGDGCFKQYHNDEAKTANVFGKGNWLHTGDIGYLDKDGHLIALGRVADVITVGKNSLYPACLEKKMLDCPLVHDVVVIQVRADDPMAEICACIVPINNDVKHETIKQFCENRFTEDETNDFEEYMLPKHYVVFASFPTLTTGKLDRKRLRTLAEERVFG